MPGLSERSDPVKPAWVTELNELDKALASGSMTAETYRAGRDALVAEAMQKIGVQAVQLGMDPVVGTGGFLEAAGKVMLALGHTYQDMRRFDAATDAYQHALEVFRELGNRGGEAIALANLGELLHQRGQLDDAVQFQQRAIDILQETGAVPAPPQQEH